MFILIQSATGPLVPLLRAAEAHHRAFCAACGAAYAVYYTDPGDSPYWHKIHYLRAWLANAAPGDLGVWLDADAWVADMAAPVAGALPPGADLGAFRGYGQPCIHTGVLFVRAGVAVRRWLDALWAGADRSGYLDYQISRFYEAQPAITVHPLPYAWHGIAHRPPPGPRYIRALHGVPRAQAAATMRAELNRLPLPVGGGPVPVNPIYGYAAEGPLYGRAPA